MLHRDKQRFWALVRKDAFLTHTNYTPPPLAWCHRALCHSPTDLAYFFVLSDTRQGTCYMEYSNGRCSGRFPHLLARVDCCCDERLGKAWGVGDCQRCPLPGSSEFHLRHLASVVVFLLRRFIIILLIRILPERKDRSVRPKSKVIEQNLFP